jgi:hypothetical protein
MLRQETITAVEAALRAEQLAEAGEIGAAMSVDEALA